jgi:hypothetical protein
MLKITTKDGEVDVPAQLVVRMAERMHKLGGKGRSEHYAQKARARIDKGSKRASDLAIVAAAGG